MNNISRKTDTNNFYSENDICFILSVNAILFYRDVLKEFNINKTIQKRLKMIKENTEIFR